MKITRALLNTLRTDIDAALAAVATKHGVELQVGNASFRDQTATIKLELAVPNEDGEIENQAAIDFKLLAKRHGLQASDLGRTFELHGKRYTIIGMNPRSRKYPVLAEAVDGKLYKFGAFAVQRALESGAEVA